MSKPYPGEKIKNAINIPLMKIAGKTEFGHLKISTFYEIIKA
jgi:hypothetical protein